MSHVFVSYVRENQAMVTRLCDTLRANGVEVWNRGRSCRKCLTVNIQYDS